MPSVKPNESKDKYMSRCVPMLIKEGKSQKAAIGQCYGMYKSKWHRKKTKASLNEPFEEPTWEEHEKNGFIIDI
jgi:hypothetical protein